MPGAQDSPAPDPEAPESRVTPRSRGARALRQTGRAGAAGGGHRHCYLENSLIGESEYSTSVPSSGGQRSHQLNGKDTRAPNGEASQPARDPHTQMRALSSSVCSRPHPAPPAWRPELSLPVSGAHWCQWPPGDNSAVSSALGVPCPSLCSPRTCLLRHRPHLHAPPVGGRCP